MSSDHPGSPDKPSAKNPTVPMPTAGPPAKDPAAKFTRAGALWTALIFGFLILILLLVFITQNMESMSFTFLGWHWSLPLGVAMLLAAIGGGLLTVTVGTVRILQLRRAAKKIHVAALKASGASAG
jgi:uncharacterized integral membrane protein